MLEIVGQKRAVSQDLTSRIRVNTKNYQIRFSRKLMDEYGLKPGSNIGLGYDNAAKAVYLIPNYKGKDAVKLGKEGMFTSNWHSNKLAEFFGTKNSSFNVDIAADATPQTDGDGKSFTAFALTLSPIAAVTRLRTPKVKSEDAVKDSVKESEPATTDANIWE